MGKKTMVPIKGKGYKIAHGYVTGTSAAYAPVSKTFDSKIIAIFFRYYKSSDSTTNGVSGYYVNPNVEFWNNNDTLFDNLLPTSAPTFYIYNTANSATVTNVDDYTVSLKFSASASAVGYCYYTAILEDDSIGGDPMFLLNGTILYTDGAVSSNVSGAIQTLETNKYKIKSNALVTIAGATYANISN